MEKHLPTRSFGTVLSKGENRKFHCYSLDYFCTPALFMSHDVAGKLGSSDLLRNNLKPDRLDMKFFSALFSLC